MKKNTILHSLHRGFTLVEMMITVAILGILAAIAVPGYQNYVEKGQLADAKRAATALRQDFETARLQRPRAFQTRAGFETEFDNAKNRNIQGEVNNLYNFNVSYHPTDANAVPTGFSLSITPKRSSKKYGLTMNMAGKIEKCDYANGTLSTSSCEKF